MTTDEVTRPVPPVPTDAAGRAASTEREAPLWDATAADPTWGPRYLAVAGPHGLRRIVRADGLPLGTPTRASPPPFSERDTRTTTFASFGAAMRAAARRRQIRRGRKREGLVASAGPAPAKEQLVRWRLEAGLGQRELARRCGLSRSTVAELEAGRRDSPAARRRVAAHLGHGDPAEWVGEVRVESG
jgi:hypothetical protein